MNIGTITTIGAKGQIVIPQKIRKALQITRQTPLQIVLAGKSVAIYPIRSIIRDIDTENSYESILAKTQGSWSKLPDEYAAYRKREQKEAKKMRKIW